MPLQNWTTDRTAMARIPDLAMIRVNFAADDVHSTPPRTPRPSQVAKQMSAGLLTGVSSCQRAFPQPRLQWQFADAPRLQLRGQFRFTKEWWRIPYYFQMETDARLLRGILAFGNSLSYRPSGRGKCTPKDPAMSPAQQSERLNQLDPAVTHCCEKAARDDLWRCSRAG